MANIPACYLGSAQTNSSMVLDGIFRKEYRLVYVTPEYVTCNSGFLKDVASKVGKYTLFYIRNKYIRKMSLKNQAKIQKHLRNTGKLNFKRKVKKLSRLTVASSGLLLLLETVRILRNI